MCWDSKYYYVYKKSVWIWYQSNYKGIEKGYHLLELDEEKIFNKTQETVLLQQVGLMCFKISSKLEIPPRLGEFRWIQVAFSNGIDTSVFKASKSTSRTRLTLMVLCLRIGMMERL